MARPAFLNIGYGSIVSVGKIIAIIAPEAAPIKRIAQHARDHDQLVDATHGRRTRSVIICDNERVILSAIQPETLHRRLEDCDIGVQQGENASSDEEE